jgi:hypothetical protein
MKLNGYSIGILSVEVGDDEVTGIAKSLGGEG